MAGDGKGVLLEASAAIGEGEVVLDLRIRNERGDEVALLDRLFERDVDGRHRFDRSLCFVDVEERTLHVAQQLLPVPEDLSVGEMVLPGATRLAGGASHEHALVLTMPVVACNPYRKAWLDLRAPARREVVACAPGEVDVIVVHVGWVPTAQVRLEPWGPAHPGVARVLGDPTTSQRVAEATLRLPQAVPVLDYAVPPSPTETP